MPKRSRIARAKRKIVGEKDQDVLSSQGPSASLSPTPSVGSTAGSSLGVQDHRQSNQSSNTQIQQSTSAKLVDSVSGSSHVIERFFKDGPGDLPLRQPRRTPLKTEQFPIASTEPEKEAEKSVKTSPTDTAAHRKEGEAGQEAATQSQLDPLANIPTKRRVIEEDKQTGQTQKPSPAASNVSELSATHQSPSERRRPYASGENIRASLPLRSPGTGREDDGSSSSMTSQTQPPPVFIMGDADGARFAPFMGEDSPDSNESMTDIIMRDQIRRSEAVLGRSLSNRERDTMISYYQDMRRGRGAPSEANKPTTTIHSPTNQKEAKDEPGSFDLFRDPAGRSRAEPEQPPSTMGGPSHAQPFNDSGPAALGKTPWEDNDASGKSEPERGERSLEGLSEEDLRKEIERLEAQLRDVAQGGLTLLRLERDAVEGRLASLEAELDAVKAELSDLKACFEACTDAENGNLKDGKRAWDSPQPAHNQRGGLFGIKSVMFAMAVLVWLVTEAMLHSKRLADGYGGYVNGGYNGLGSVLIFGTWVKFMVFEVAVVFLGVLASGAVMG